MVLLGVLTIRMNASKDNQSLSRTKMTAGQPLAGGQEQPVEGIRPELS